jgi:hypothetical protein
VTIATFEPDHQQELATTAAPDWVNLLAPAIKLGEVLAATEFVPRGLRNRPEAVAACILYGHELGIDPMQSLAGIDVVEGRPSPSAELLRALIYSNGHELWVEEATGTRVTVAGRRKGTANVVKVAWTLDMAKAAGLAGKHNWRSYPRQMLTARATSELARVLFPDVIRGLGEIPDTPDGEQALGAEPPAGSEAQPDPGTTPMRRKPRAVKAPEPAQSQPAPEPAPQPEQPPQAPPEPSEPQPEPEPPAPTPEQQPPAADSITDAQLQKLNIQLREQVGGLREAKLQLLSEVLGRQVTSSKELTISDATKAIDALQRIADGIDPMPGSGAG